MAKKLSKILWYGAEKDALGKPVIPPLSPSVEKHLEGLNEGEIYIHNDDEYPALYIRTNKDKIVAIVGAEALMKYFLRKDQPDTAREVITFEKGLNVGEFVTGASGASFFKDLTTGQTIMELDKLYVRMKAFFETLTIVEAQTISGKQIISPAGSVRCTNVEEYDDYYRCYFLNEQDGEKIENKFIVGDQVYSQMFNAKTGTSNNISNRYYWRLVTGVGENYIDLSKTDCDADSDAPMVGDVLNQRGHRYPENSERMNFIETSTVDGFSPSITLFHGVNSFSLAGKDYVQFGVDKTTNKAFMNVYGDMYVGDRNKTAYMRYTQEEGLVICGKLDVGTKLGDSYLKDLISASTPEGYQEFVEKVTQDLEGLQAQIDGTIDSYFFQYEPSLNNYPASDWDTENEKKAHLNDTFTNLVDGRSWRWSLDGTYKWVEITDTATTKALALAGKAQDTADGKRRVFVDTPYPPYDKGDLWSRGSNYPLMICVVPKASGAYEEGDFDYADNNAKLMEEMQTLVSNTKSELNNSIGQAKEAANKYTDEGIESAKEDINASIDELEKAKANVTEVYSKSEADGKITEAETSAINAAKAQADAAIALSETTIKAYADGIVDDEEAARIKQAQENLAEAKAYAEEQAIAARQEIENIYLFQALTESPSTEIANGLVLTSLIQLRDTQSNIMSGINGLINASKGDKSIATWWGGDMLDLIDYYRWDGTQWIVKSGLTEPSNIPSGLIRMDGTGYLAKGKFWWDNDGKIYADPTALFLSFDVENEGASLSATILDIRDKQTEFANMWTEKTDSNGTKYLYTTYPLVTQGGVTMYAGTSGLDVEGIYDGLPIDGKTIYWENGVLKAVGGGGTADAVAWENITGKPSFATVATSGSYNDLLNKPTLLSSFTNDLGFVTESALSGKYLPLSGGTINNTSTSDILKLKTTLGDNPRILIYGSSGNVLTALGKWDDYTYLTNFKSGTQCWELRLFDNNTIQFGYGATNYPILHSNNYTSYTYSQSTIDSKLSGYLPLSGGTIKNETTSPLAIDTTGTEANLRIRINGSSKASFGYKTGVGTLMRDSSARSVVIGDDGVLKYGTDTSLNIVLHSGNYSSYALPLTGGTLTGKLTINTSSYGNQLEIYRNQSNGNSAIRFSNSEKVLGDIGICGSGGLYPYQPLFSDRTNTYQIYHSGNLTKLSQLTNDSGFITSSASISGNAATATKLATARTIWGQSFDGSGNVDGTLRVNAVSGSYTQGIRVYQNGTGYANLMLGSSTLTAKNGTDSNTWCLTTNSNAEFVVSRGGCKLTDTVSFGYNGNWLINGGNVGIGTTSPSYKLDVNGSLNATTIYQSGSSLNSLLGNYLPLSGGTLTGPLWVNNISSSDDNGLLSYKPSSWIGVNNTQWGVGTSVNQGVIRSNNTSLLHYRHDSGVYTIWDSGNDGSGSGLDADTLDGLHADNFAYNGYYPTTTTNNYSLKSGLYSTQKNVSGLPINNVGHQVLHMNYDGNTACQLFMAYSEDKVSYRRKASNVWQEWKEIAFTTDNVASATKLQTARTIWGQSFNGTGNVSGDLSGVGDITGSGSITIRSTGSSINLKYNDDPTKSVVLNSSSFKPYDAATNKLNLGLSSGRWRGIYGNALNLEYSNANLITLKRTASDGGAFVDYYANNQSTKYWRVGGNSVYGFSFATNQGSGESTPMIILASGYVGIGTTAPSHKLHVEGSIYSSSGIRVGSSSYGIENIELYGTRPYIDFHYGSSTADYTTRLIEGLSGQLTCTGKFRIGLGYTTSTDYNFYVSGSAYISSNLLTGGGITMYSARVLKNVIDERGLSLRELSVIKPTRYTWKDKRDDRLHIGGIADDIQQVLPEVVYRTPDGILTMDYGNAAFAIASSLIQPVISHEERIARLERENRALKEEVKRLKSA